MPKSAGNVNTEPTAIFDVTIPAPEGFEIEEVRIVANADAVNYIEQYRDAIFVARNIPFDVDAVSMADPLSLIISNQRKTSGNESIRQARQWYKNWQREAEQHATILAFTANNEFKHEPKEYPEKKTPPGIVAVPSPRYDLTDPVEYRLKQILDLFNADLNFQMQGMQHINDAVARLVQVGEEADSAGFQSEPVGEPLPQKDVTDSKDGGEGQSNKSTDSE